LAGDIPQGCGELLGVRGGKPERSEYQERLGLRAGDLVGERAERCLRGGGVVVCFS